MTYNKVPCLVIWRPPVELPFGRSIIDECLAVVPLEYLAELHRRIETLKKEKEALINGEK